MVKTIRNTKVITRSIERYPDIWVTPDVEEGDINITIVGDTSTWLQVGELEDLIEVLQEVRDVILEEK
jgi:hypothetical protein